MTKDGTTLSFVWSTIHLPLQIIARSTTISMLSKDASCVTHPATMHRTPSFHRLYINFSRRKCLAGFWLYLNPSTKSVSASYGFPIMFLLQTPIFLLLWFSPIPASSQSFFTLTIIKINPFEMSRALVMATPKEEHLVRTLGGGFDQTLWDVPNSFGVPTRSLKD